MPFYRYGVPGQDSWAHMNFGGRPGPAQCASPAFREDDHSIGDRCGRPSSALCDAPGCDAPMCEHHRTKDGSRKNTDFCPKHKDLAHPTLCFHERLDENGICRSCGEDKRGFGNG